MKSGPLAACLAVALASAALAHTGVKNPAVKARMHAMTMMAAEFKTLGQMVKGEADFDPAAAHKAVAEIAKYADETPALFEAEEDDPKSEAKPVIWTRFDEFVAKSDRLEKAAGDLAGRIVDDDDLRAAVQTLGAECKSCHEVFRE